ncbi:GNAT family N-acetyltransferase [Erwinia sp. P6884]|uniref:GNAT family N-acetyltransferase n=1 Tax=Erwinia sp. P6884 TaxID=3141450 RepID=UPI003194B342
MTGNNQVSLVPAKAQRHVVENLFHYYVYELAAMGKWPCSAEGVYTFNASLLDPHWQRDDHWPYLIYQDNELAGFCLLRRYPFNPERYDIDQFFIIRKFMGSGVGKAAFNLAVKNFPGRWQTRVMLENLPALKFWRSAIGALTQGDFTEQIQTDDDLQMHFITYDVC